MTWGEAPNQEPSLADPWGSPFSQGASLSLPDVISINLDGGKSAIVKPHQLKKIGTGGTGNVFLIQDGNLAGNALKLYHEKELKKHGAEFESKVARMLAAKPSNIEIELNGKRLPQFAWPKAIANDEEGQFIGYLMPYVAQDDYYDLVSYVREIESLDRKHQAITERIQVARNLSGALAGLHRAGHYFVDMKPGNIKIHKATSTVVFIDTDGFSIAAGQFPAHHATPKYVAPELLDMRPEQFSEFAEQDHYVLALIIFEILDYGNRPWECRVTDKSLLSDDTEQDSETRAKLGLYAYGLVSSHGIAPKPTSIYRYWPNSIRQLFDRAFSRQNGQNRPAAKEWFNALSALVKHWEQSFKRCSKYPDDERHRHFSGTGCFCCEVFEQSPVNTPPPKPKPPLRDNGIAKGKHAVEPKPPKHWTDLLPDKYHRLRDIRDKLERGRTFPTTFNMVAGCLQFIWLLAAGLYAHGTVAALVFFGATLFVIWNPFPVILMAYAGYLCLLFIFHTLCSDYFLYQRLDKLVDGGGGFKNIHQENLTYWLRPNIGGIGGGLVLIAVLAVAGTWRVNQVDYIRDRVAYAIQSTESVRLDIESQARGDVAAGVIKSLSTYYENSPNKQIFNAEADTRVVGDKIVIVMKDVPLVEGKTVFRKPQVANGVIIRWSCWSEDIPAYVMPSDCQSRPVL